MIQKIQAWDARVILYINQHFKHKFLDYFFIGVTYLGSEVFALGFILALAILPGSAIDSFALYAAAALVLASLTVGILKNTIKRPRPFVSLYQLKSLKIGIDEYSFPSGHTTAAFCLAVTSALVTRGHMASGVYLFLALLVALSRVYLGVHYPSDVLAGSFIGSFYAVFIHMIREVIQYV